MYDYKPKILQETSLVLVLEKEKPGVGSIESLVLAVVRPMTD
jgi:hypothetical protein